MDLKIENLLAAFRSVKSRIDIASPVIHEHRRGYYLAGTFMLDGKEVFKYVQHGDGSAHDFTPISPDAISIMTKLIEDLNFKDAMIKDNWASQGDVIDLDYAISTFFEALIDLKDQKAL